MTEIFDIDGLQLCVSSEHRFGTDAVKLAEFTASSKSLKGQVVCDLCTGCGIVPFLLLSNKNEREPLKIYALDIDGNALELLQESVKMNSLNGIIFPVLEDLKDITKIPAGSVDLVTVNPPYYKANDGFKRKNGGTARHELLCELDDAVRAAARLLKFGGRLKMCHIPERLADVITSLRKYNLEPKLVEFVVNNTNEPWLMLVDAKKGGKPGMKVRFV